MADEPYPADDDEPYDEEHPSTQAEYARMRTRLRCALVDGPDTEAGARERLSLHRRVWHLRALLDLEAGDVDGAAKASREAVRLGDLATKAAKAELADRVSALEVALAEGQRRGRGIAAAAARKAK